MGRPHHTSGGLTLPRLGGLPRLSHHTAGASSSSSTAPTLEDVLKYPLILPERDTGTYERVREALDTVELDFRVAMEVGTWETVKHYVSWGWG